MSHSLEIKHKARSLFIEAGLTYEQVSGETGVALSVVKSWGSEGNWGKERKDFEARFLNMTTKVDKAIVDQIEKAAQSKNAQDFYAVGTLMKARATITSAFRRTNQPVDRAAIFLELMKEEIEYLRDKDPEALRHLQPHITGFAEHIKNREA
jgi:hypothetical protein